MKLGLCYFPTHYGMRPDHLAAAAEERGFESLLFCEHTHIPASRLSPYPLEGDLPKKYWHTYDPFVACTSAASATSTLRIGTGICLVVQRDPITTAKAVASVDQLSGGRFLFGVGAGWNREEMLNHGTNPRSRMALLVERIEAMREIWTNEEAEYHGRFVDFDPIWAEPKPAQTPLPVLIGGMGPTVEDRVLAVGDEWLAECVPDDEVDQFANRIAQLQSRAADAGRGRIPISLFDASANEGMIDRYTAAGVDRCLFEVTDGDSSTILRQLDQLAKLIG